MSVTSKTLPNLKRKHLVPFLDLNFIICWTPFGINVLYIPWLPEESCFATGIMRNVFSTLQTLSFWYKNSIRFWTHVFHYLSDMMSKNMILGHPLKMAPQICQTPPKSEIVYKAVTLLGGPWTNPFPESIPIDLFMIFGRFMIDVGSLFCNLVRFVDGFVIVWGTLFLQICFSW